MLLEVAPFQILQGFLRDSGGAPAALACRVSRQGDTQFHQLDEGGQLVTDGIPGWPVRRGSDMEGYGPDPKKGRIFLVDRSHRGPVLDGSVHPGPPPRGINCAP